RLAPDVTLFPYTTLFRSGLTEYPHLLRALSDARQGLGYSAAAVGMSAGASPDHARLIPIALLLVLLALTLWLGMSARADADCFEIGRAEVCTPVTSGARM